MRLFIFFGLSLFIFSCAPRTDDRSIIVAAAANVQYPIKEINKEFEAQYGISIKPVIASSGKLTSQIIAGAPFDVFISADTRYPDILFKEGFAVNPPEIYAEGILVLWTMNKDILLSEDLSPLLDTDIKKIAIANPEFAPYGIAAKEVLIALGIKDRVEAKLVFGQNIAQTSQYIITGAADVGFTAKSVVLSDAMKENSNWIDIDPLLYAPIKQAAVLIKRNELNPNADKFYEFLFSENCKSIFLKYGYRIKR